MIREIATALIRRMRRGDWYDQDGLQTLHNHEFMKERRFKTAYDRAIRAAGEEYNFHWRCHVALWLASSAVRLPGDFVECGVNKGALSSAIMQYLDWNSVGKMFYLLDTFGGLDARFVSEDEKREGALEKSRDWIARGVYESNVERVRANFAEWRNIRIIQGAVPETLPQVQADSVAYLHIDMNCAAPEIAAAEYFWPRLAPGAYVLLDDYAYVGYQAQKVAMDGFAGRVGVSVLTLPTGQGVLQKPFAQNADVQA